LSSLNVTCPARERPDKQPEPSAAVMHRIRVPSDHPGSQGPPARKEFQARMGLPESPENREKQMAFGRPRQAAELVRMELGDPLDLQEEQGELELPVEMEFQAAAGVQANLEILDHQDLLDPLDPMENPVLKVPMEIQVLLEERDLPDQKDRVVSQEMLDKPEVQVAKEVMENLALLVQLDLPEQLVIPDNLDPLERKEPLEFPVQMVNIVRVPDELVEPLLLRLRRPRLNQIYFPFQSDCFCEALLILLSFSLFEYTYYCRL